MALDEEFLCLLSYPRDSTSNALSMPSPLISAVQKTQRERGQMNKLFFYKYLENETKVTINIGEW